MCQRESIICSNHPGVFTLRQVSQNTSPFLSPLILTSFYSLHSGKICVPINPKAPDDFNCQEVPTLTTVINEMGQIPAAQRKQEDGDSITTPSLEPFMQTFKEFLEASRQQSIAHIKQQNKEKAAAAQGAAAAGNSMDF